MNIQINGYPFKVEFVEGDIEKMNPDKEHYNLGLTEYFNATISIRKGLNEQITRSTVIHELIHAFIFAYGYTVEGEEAMCNFFGSQADEILRLTNEIMGKGVKENEPD